MSEKKEKKISSITNSTTIKQIPKKKLLAKLRDLIELPLLLRRHY